MMDIMSSIRVRIKTNSNGTFDAVLETDDGSHEDNIGALYYVIAVVFIYGLSIVMMIASHIRKNKQDNQLRNYLKEMSILRKNDRREKFYSKMSTLSPATTKPATLNLVQEEKSTEDASAQTRSLLRKDSGDTLMRKASLGEDSVFYAQSEEGYVTPRSSFTPKQEKMHFQFEVINEHVEL
ncbi:hypothetical protein FSP39_024013 [Pinctada imbricata]|uniref:Uncharacterized protein n=1 Tax=Pinctada imbricata TaxID=66713 RepID=A0AA88XUL1_PINIB|nr:hypothetical protein FSP39_024013 [Pinctada imbricata]